MTDESPKNSAKNRDCEDEGVVVDAVRMTPTGRIKRVKEVRVIRCYDREKYRRTGLGVVSKTFDADDPELEEKIALYKKSMAEKNEAFTASLKEGKFKIVKESLGDGKLLVKDVVPPTVADRTKLKILLDARTGNTMCLLGSSKSGKTTALMKIYDKYYAKNKEIVSTLWSAHPNIAAYRGHKRLLKCGTWDKFGEELIKTEKKIQTKTNNSYEFLNIFDDVLDIRSRLVEDLMLTYRNAKMSTIISMQYSNKMPKSIRSNCNNILAFNFNTDESIEVVIRSFLMSYLRNFGLKTMPEMINWYKSMTRDHGFIYIKPTEDFVSFHKIEL